MGATDQTVDAKKRRSSSHRLRRWLPYAGATLLIALLVAGMWPQPVPVETARATVGMLRATVDEEGKTRIRQRYTISAPVSGQLQRIPFKAGAEVRAGETTLAIIAPLTPPLLDARTRSLAEARRDSAAANFEKSRAMRDWSASELRRFEQLNKEKTISPQELEAARVREETAARETAAADALLREAEAELATAAAAPQSNSPPVIVLAPASGKVLRVFEESAKPVSAGTPLLELGEPADLEVVVEVLSRDGAGITPGARVELEQVGAPGTPPLLAHVRLVEPAGFTKISALGVEEQRVRVIADLDTPPAERAGVGDQFRVEARIVIWESARTLKVPVGALFRKSGQWAAFVVSEGRARLKTVEAGRSSGAMTQILSGLQEGEEVILYPGSRVREGQRVREIQL